MDVVILVFILKDFKILLESAIHNPKIDKKARIRNPRIIPLFFGRSFVRIRILTKIGRIVNPERNYLAFKFPAR